MSTSYPCLVQRGRQFYFRVAIPQKYWGLTNCKEIGYSLHTSSWEEALRKWRYELYHFQRFMNIFVGVCMKVNNNKLVLNRTEVDKVLMYELERKQFFIEEHTEEIIEGSITSKDVELYTPQDETSNPDKVKRLMEEVVMEYLTDLVHHQKANITLRTTYQKLRDKEILLGLDEVDSTGYAWFNSLSRHMGTLEKYLRKSVEAIYKDENYAPRSPKVVSLLRTYDEKRTSERLSKASTNTPWEKVFKRFFRNKENLKEVRSTLEDVNRHSLKICFAVIGKNTLESITQQDCRRLCDDIYRVPKHWKGELKEGQTISDILNSGKKCISKTTIKGHLITFKEFMRYCVREQIINNSFNEAVDLPHAEKQARSPFTTAELKKIFNVATYPDPKSRNNQARFWIPLVALYQGARLNEIAQLDVDDIVAREGLECIYINDDEKDQSVKNKASKRIIPIHPVLKELGFLEYVGYQQRNKATKLFSELTYTKKQGYSSALQKWFARYLDEVGIKGSDKVFHSFRHTFETKALEKLLHTEHQNRLCGWTNKGIGQSVYGKHLQIKVLYDELCKIDYPIKKELNALKEVYKQSYVIKFFES